MKKSKITQQCCGDRRQHNRRMPTPTHVYSPEEKAGIMEINFLIFVSGFVIGLMIAIAALLPRC